MEHEDYVQMNNIYYFNAHTRADEDVVRTFIVRKEILQELTSSIESEKRESIPQHYLVIGARGLGKSTLLKRLEIRLKEEGYKDRFIPILFPEEQYNVDRISKFWLNSLDALADTFESEKNEQQAKDIDEMISSLELLREEDLLADKSYEALQKICKSYERRPVFLIDNIDLLFDGISGEQQFKLRKLLTTNGAPIFVGASTHNPDDSTNYDAPFYDAFDTIYLKPLDAEEMRELLVQLAVQTNRGENIREIYSKSEQLGALHSLTGGNPRVGTFLFQLISNGLSDKIFENLNSLLDLITPLYKSNFEQLSKQSQLIVDALALNWDPCDLDTLSRLTKLENNQLSAQLDRLMKSAWVERGRRFSEEKRSIVAKSKNYSIRERFFNIWYIMRRASRRHRGDLKSLTCFLETFYSREHLSIEKTRILSLIKNSPDADRVIYGLALARTYNRKEQDNEMEKEIYMAILEKTEGDEDKIAQYLHPEYIPNNIYDEFFAGRKKWWTRLSELINNDKLESAHSFITAIIKKNVDDAYAWGRLGYVLDLLNLGDDAEKAFLSALKIEGSSAYYWGLLGTHWKKVGELEKSEDAFRQSILLDRSYKFGWYKLGNVLRRAKKYVESESVLKEGIKENGADFLSVSELGFLFYQLDRNIEAEDAFRKATSIDETYERIWVMYARSLRRNGKYREAIAACEKAILANPKYRNTYELMGDLYWQKDIDEYELAESSYRKAIELDPIYIPVLRKLAALLGLELKRFHEAEEIYRFVASKDHTSESWFELGEFLHFESQKLNEAEEAYKIAIELDPQNDLAWGFLAVLYHYDTHRYEKAKDCYEKALSIDPVRLLFWRLLGDLEQDYLNDKEAAKTAYLKTVDVKWPDSGLHDYLFLLRDKLGDIKEARRLFESNYDSLSEHKDVCFLQNALFALYDGNWGISKQCWNDALDFINGTLPEVSFDCWYRSVAVTQARGYGRALMELFEANNHDRQLRPLYEALKALEMGSADYLINIAEEVREPAKVIYEFMNRYKQ